MLIIPFAMIEHNVQVEKPAHLTCKPMMLPCSVCWIVSLIDAPSKSFVTTEHNPSLNVHKHLTTDKDFECSYSSREGKPE
jgi:hypothetical protein